MLIARGDFFYYICVTGALGRIKFPVVPESDNLCEVCMCRLVVILLDVCWGWQYISPMSYEDTDVASD